MPKIAPIKRRELIKNLRKLGFSGPFAGGNHGIMERGSRTVILPNPHRSDIGKDFLLRILSQAGIEREAWEKL